MSATLKKFLPKLAAAAIAALLPACANIDRQWSGASTPASDPFSGRWDGKWTSVSRPGEGGKLRCVFAKADATHYRATFEAHWKTFATSYTAVFTTVQHGKELRFEGTHTLPAVFGGVYRYRGTVTPQRFAADYDSSYDRGKFEMTRPAL